MINTILHNLTGLALLTNWESVVALDLRLATWLARLAFSIASIHLPILKACSSGTTPY